MKAISAKRVLLIIMAILSISLMVGCARIVGVSKSADYRGGKYYPTCLVNADKALDEARMAGKDKECPDEFNALKDMIDNAYKTHLACNTEGACKMAKEAAGKAKLITCPQKPVVKLAPPPPTPVDGKVGAWSDWSACSAPCGGGTQSRTRPVVTQPVDGGAPLPALSESRSCNTQACMEEQKINLLIEFDFDKSVIKKEFYPNADAVGAFLKKNSTVNITLDGWTDYIGSDKYNKKLSQRRADAVKAYLVDKYKIDPARITAVGHGKSFKYDNKTEVGRYKNRRVEMN